jgi:hypothetical protein
MLRRSSVMLVALLGIAGLSGCKSAAQAEAAVFSSEQVICMVAAMMEQEASGPAQQVADDIVQGCQFAPALTQDVINFVNAFQNLTAMQKARWVKRLQDRKALKK